MHATNPDPTRRRLPMVALVLLVTFVAALAGAAWIVHLRTGLPREHAADLLSAIARDTLPPKLGPTTPPQWFIEVDSAGNLLAISVQRQVRLPDQYVIARVSVLLRRQEMTIEHWRLANNIAASHYQAVTKPPAIYRQFPAAGNLTVIQQEAGKVVVECSRADHPGVIRLEAPAPANLIPEGAMDLAARYVAARGEKALFTIIVNETANLGGRLHFTPVRMTPLAGNRVEISEAHPRGEATRIAELDSAGLIERTHLLAEDVYRARTTEAKIAQVLSDRQLTRLGIFAKETLMALTAQTPAPAPKPPTSLPTADLTLLTSPGRP